MEQDGEPKMVQIVQRGRDELMLHPFYVPDGYWAGIVGILPPAFPSLSTGCRTGYMHIRVVERGKGKRCTRLPPCPTPSRRKPGKHFMRDLGLNTRKRRNYWARQAASILPPPSGVNTGSVKRRQYWPRQAASILVPPSGVNAGPAKQRKYWARQPFVMRTYCLWNSLPVPGQVAA